MQVGDLQELGLWRRAQRESRQHRGSRIRGPAREGGETPGTPGPGVRHGASGAEHGECGGDRGRSREPAGGRQGRAVGPRTGRNWWEWGFLFLVLASCPWQVPGFAQVVIDNQWFMWPGAQHVTAGRLSLSRCPFHVAGPCSFLWLPWLRSGWTAQPWAPAGSVVRFFESQVPPADAQTPITRGTGWVVGRVRGKT